MSINPEKWRLPNTVTRTAGQGSLIPRCRNPSGHHEKQHADGGEKAKMGQGAQCPVLVAPKTERPEGAERTEYRQDESGQAEQAQQTEHAHPRPGGARVDRFGKRDQPEQSEQPGEADRGMQGSGHPTIVVDKALGGAASKK